MEFWLGLNAHREFIDHSTICPSRRLLQSSNDAANLEIIPKVRWNRVEHYSIYKTCQI